MYILSLHQQQNIYRTFFPNINDKINISGKFMKQLTSGSVIYDVILLINNSTCIGQSNNKSKISIKIIGKESNILVLFG